MTSSVVPVVMGSFFSFLLTNYCLGHFTERPCSPDVALGAYLMTHLQERCENCETTITPQWRKGWYSSILGRTVVLCNKCGLKYNKNQFCGYCMYIYYKEEDKKASGKWYVCSSCTRWVHASCEAKYGTGQAPSSKDPYVCPNCEPEKMTRNNYHTFHSGVCDVFN